MRARRPWCLTAVVAASVFAAGCDARPRGRFGWSAIVSPGQATGAATAEVTRGAALPADSPTVRRRYVVAGVLAGPKPALSERYADAVRESAEQLARVAAQDLVRRPAPATPSGTPTVSPSAIPSALPTAPPSASPAAPPVPSSSVSAPGAPPGLVSGLLFDDVARVALGAADLRIDGQVVGASLGSLARDLAAAGGSILGNNGGSIIGNNGGSFIGNNGGNLVADVAGLFRGAPATLAAARAQYRLSIDPIPEGAVLPTDLDCRTLAGASKTGARGEFQFEALADAPVGGWLLLRATERRGEQLRTYMALAPAPSGDATVWAELTPASTLLAKVFLRSLGRCDTDGDSGGGGLPAGGGAITISAEALTTALQALEASMGDAALVAAVDLEVAEAAAVYDVMAAAEPALGTAVDEALASVEVGATAANDGAPPPAPAPAPAGGSGGSSGGGGSTDPQPSQVALGFSTASGFDAIRVAGDAAGGSALGTSALTASFRGVGGIAVAPSGTFYVSDPVRHAVRRVPTSGATSYYAGVDGSAGVGPDAGVATLTRLDAPGGLVWESASEVLYVADTGNDKIRAVFGTGLTSLVANTGDQPVGLAAGPGALLYMTERGTGAVRRVSQAGALTTIATLTAPEAIAVDPANAVAWVGDGAAVRCVTGITGAGALDPAAVYTAGAGKAITGLAYDQAGTLFVAEAAADGRSGTRLLRLSVDASGRLQAGRTAEAVAGTGGAGAVAADFAVPTTTVANALTLRLAGAARNALAIDLHQAASPTVLSGLLYFGNGFDDGGGGGVGQVARLAPLP